MRRGEIRNKHLSKQPGRSAMRLSKPRVRTAIAGHKFFLIKGQRMAFRYAAILAVMFLTFINPILASANSFIGPSGKPVHQVKCTHSPTSCYEEAHKTCQGPYQIINSESHAGGIFADLIPGPVTWYSFTYACGRSDGRLAAFPFHGSPRRAFVNPFPAPAPTPMPRPPVNCTSNRVGNSVYTNCY